MKYKMRHKLSCRIKSASININPCSVWCAVLALAAALLLAGCEQPDTTPSPQPDTPPSPPILFHEWTRYFIPEMRNYLTVNTVAYAPGVGFVAGSGTDYRKPAVAISPNGNEGSWRVREIDDLANYNSFAGKISLLNGKFLMTRGSGVRFGLVSADGETWTETNIGFGTKAHAFGNGIYVAGGQHGQAAWSDDDMATWHALTEEETTFDKGEMAQLYIIAAAFGNGVFVMGGGRGHTAVSSDGKTWSGARGDDSSSERIFEGPDGFIDAIIFVNGKFVALGGKDYGETRSATSRDGINWTRGGSLPGLTNNKDGPRMAAGGGWIVAVAGNGKAAYSQDGITWTAAETGFNGMEIKDAAYGAGRFVIVGYQGRAAYCDAPEKNEE
jgi:hypothetical protein